MGRRRKRKRARPARPGAEAVPAEAPARAAAQSGPGETPSPLPAAALPPTLWVVLLCWLGLLDALYLLFEHWYPSAGSLCGAASSCARVLGSSYATLGELPLAALGLGFYALLGGLYLGALGAPPRMGGLALRAADGLSFAGVLASAVLLYTQGALVQAFCPLCTVSAGLTAAIHVLAGRIPRERGPARAGWALALALTLSLGALLTAAALRSARQAEILGRLGTEVELPAPASSATPPAGATPIPGEAQPETSPAPVELEVFFEFRCPACQQMAPAVRRIREEYAGRVRVRYRPFPIVGVPRYAEEAAECAREQGRFLAFYDRLSAHPQELAEDDIPRHAAAAGLEMEAFRGCWTSPRARARVEASVRAAGDLGLEGVPSVFINGRRVAHGGALSYDQLRLLVEQELKMR